MAFTSIIIWKNIQWSCYTDMVKFTHKLVKKESKAFSHYADGHLTAIFFEDSELRDSGLNFYDRS